MERILFDFHECLEKGLLRKTVPSKAKARKSLEASLKWLEEAEKNLKSRALKSSLLSAYLAVFHAARSILFLDGYREKSHACIARYLETNYVGKGLLEAEWVEMLDHFRELRHSDQYSFSFFTSVDESKDTITKSRDFVSRMEKLVHQILKT
ncbi:MAG: HEPN domain-containing protein [Candidatus Aminicenantes bacterium]|nr:MAG: HEPN domain-containing protein [Candidatus Aminicenantes bacterium]